MEGNTLSIKTKKATKEEFDKWAEDRAPAITVIVYIDGDTFGLRTHTYKPPDDQCTPDMFFKLTFIVDGMAMILAAADRALTVAKTKHEAEETSNEILH